MLVLLVSVVLPYLSHPLSLLSFWNLSGWVGSCEPLFLLLKEEWFIFLLFMGYQGAEEDAEKLQLTVRLLQAFLAEAQVVCIGQPMLIAGDLNADPAVIPCLAVRVFLLVGMSSCALAYSLRAGLAPDATCRFSREDGTGSRRDFFVGCPGALAASQCLSMLLIGGSLLTFQYLLTFVLVPGWLTLPALLYVSLFGLLVGYILLIDPPRRPFVLSRTTN